MKTDALFKGQRFAILAMFLYLVPVVIIVVVWWVRVGEVVVAAVVLVTVDCFLHVGVL